MKIQIPALASGGDSAVTSALPISFSEVGPGKFRALVPVTFSGTSPNLRSVFPVTLEADASDAQKGKRRVMVKVSMPYRRGIINPVGGQPQLGSDAGEISCHMVVSVPKALIQDLTVPDANNTNASIVASSSLFVVMQLLKSLSIITATGHPRPLIPDDSLGNAAPPIPVPVGESPSNEFAIEAVPTTITADNISFSKDEMSGSVAIVIPKGMQSTSGTAVGIDSAIFDPIVRGLFGTRPIEEDSEVYMPTTYNYFS